MKQNKFMETKKAILEALEDKPKYYLDGLVPAFFTLAILGVGIDISLQSLKEIKLK